MFDFEEEDRFGLIFVLELGGVIRLGCVWCCKVYLRIFFFGEGMIFKYYLGGWSYRV